MKTKATRFGWLALGAVLAPAALLTGCGGSNNGGLLGLNSGGSTQNGSFSGTATNLGAGRTGTFTLRTRTDNTLNGSLVVGNSVRNRITPRAATVPNGTYSFSGTRSGNSFTAMGTSTGTPSFNYTVTGTIASSTNAGSFTFAGNINGEPFSVGGGINVVGGGTGGGTGSGAFTATFSNNSSNAIVSSFTTVASVGVFTHAGDLRTILGTFTAVAGTTPRTIGITLTKQTGAVFAVNDVFRLDDQDPNITGEVAYTESNTSGALKLWISNGGTVKITAISGKTLTVLVTGATMVPAPDGGGPGFVNGANGNFTLGGSGSLTSDATLN